MNPMKALRERLGWTQEDVARFADCSKNLVIRMEQGCYPEPPPVLLNFFLHNPRVRNAIGQVDRLEVLAQYRQFQKETRIEHYGRLDPNYSFLLEFDLETDTPKHPFIAWRALTGLNPTQIAKYYCLHQALIYKFEKQHYLLNSLPQPLVDALIESGYGPVIISRLEDAFFKFKAANSERVGVEVTNAPQQRRDTPTGPNRAGVLPDSTDPVG